MYILTRKNRVIHYCSEGYVYVGNTVVCESEGLTFEDCTIIKTEATIPSDILCGTYEYINGEFVKGFPATPNVLTNVITLASDNWSGNNQEVMLYGVTPTNTVIVSPTLEVEESYLEYGVKCITQDMNKLTFTCRETPQEHLSVNILIIR